jgi:hypothetical protein
MHRNNKITNHQTTEAKRTLAIAVSYNREVYNYNIKRPYVDAGTLRTW